MPCSDSLECDDPRGETISAIADHEKHEHANESCTPFCTCSCCALSSFYAQHARAYTENAPATIKQYALYEASIVASMQYAIWQPPRQS